ncbi:hypothetical protein NDU88_001486 [Pleurodeles waltl]|uniref:Uncharacterized protein n=1 Tax=Pleurodeles waltl TaxID=8319 RepID=A0AAV7Q706_PLEWA|nr:hypothetical protein NDU88_001486 [Pleurodeles waltl]
MSMRNTPNKKTGLSPHEILMSRAMRLPAVPAKALVNITDDMVLDYCKGLADVVRSFSHQLEATTLPPFHDPGHNLKAGDWVVIKKHDPAIPGIYYLCGPNAYYRLPKGWYGTCYLGIVFPKIYQLDDLKKFRNCLNYIVLDRRKKLLLA